MNIEQYRAMKAQIDKETLEEKEQPQVTEPETKPVVTETKPEEKAVPEKIEIEIDGQKLEVDFNELKNGYLRQSDYTKKTQEVSKKSKELEDAVVLYEYLKANPQVAKKIVESSEGNPKANVIDPVASKISELEDTISNMLMEQEIIKLSSKFKDFDSVGVLNTAREKGLSNLEDAYYIWKQSNSTGALDVATLTKQIREQVLAELEAEKNTDTIINAKGVPATTATRKELSSAEKKIAKNMGLTEIEYTKWKDTRR